MVAGQYIIGHFPPNLKYQVGKAIQAMHNMMVADPELVKTIRMGIQKEKSVLFIFWRIKIQSTTSEEE